MAKLKCPKCKATSVQLLSNTANVKSVKTKTTVNLNPFKPFTVFNHTEKVKKKKSAGKMLLGAATGGTALFVTGTKDNKGNQCHCLSCGNVFKTK